MADSGAQTRAQAAHAITAVMEQGKSLDAALAKAQSNLANPADRALAAALAFAVIREWRLLDALSAKMLKKPPPPLAHALVLVGLVQLRDMRVPPHAAVHATVGAANLIRMPRLRGMLNAILRRYQKEQEKLEAGLADDPALQASHPDWLVRALRADWPANWQSLLTQNNHPAPMTLRVNRRACSLDEYQRQLDAAGLPAAPVEHAPDALTLDEPAAIERLPGFAEGQVSVQDSAAQLAAPMLQTQPGMRVLDACAAPGGKAAHCLESADSELLALDVDNKRLALVDETFARLNLSGETRCADASRVEQWWDKKPFDRILIDAPCTGTGVIRRHPDIKWLRRETDVAALAQRQRELLEALWPLLAPGGILVYATCSVLRAEGAALVERFLADTKDASEKIIEAEWGVSETVGRRIAPGEKDMDGFYYARLVKSPS